jgi:hypothetical protein
MKQNQLVEHQTTDSKPNQDYIGHTPGPWHYIKCNCGHPACDKFRISSASAEGMFLEPDARLIAAAPDLLEACKAILSRLNEHGEWDEGVFYYQKTCATELQDPIRKLESATSKAEGKQ